MKGNHKFRQLLISGIRLTVFIYLTIVAAGYLNKKNYSAYYSRTLLKFHADTTFSAKTSKLPEQISQLIAGNNTGQLQELLDSNHELFSLIVTDCKNEGKQCPDQKILYRTNPSLSWRKISGPQQLAGLPFKILYRQLPSPSTTGDTSRKVTVPRIFDTQEDIVGRLYVLSSIPASFAEDYRLWLKSPFENRGPWHSYLITFLSSQLAGVLGWLIIELFLKIRRMEKERAREREDALIANADNYFRQLEDKEALLEEQEKQTSRQFSAHIARIRELEQKLQHSVEYREIAETIIHDLEEDQHLQLLSFREELERTNREKEQLRDEISNYQKASSRDKGVATRALESVITPQFTNQFEQQIFERLERSRKFQKGMWLALANFDVAVGRSGSRFCDFVVICKECLMVIEAKNYRGVSFSEGDAENDRWLSREDSGRIVEIKSNWGENPYHQVREYSMSLKKLIEIRSSWQLPIYGVVVFPEETKLDGIEERIGKFYRVTTADRLVGVLDNIEAEARREHAFSKRPLPSEIENLIRGRKVNQRLAL